MCRWQTPSTAFSRSAILHGFAGRKLPPQLQLFSKTFFEMKKNDEQTDKSFRRTRYTIRFTREEDEKIRTLMANNGYRSVSIFMRDLLFKKQIVSRREVVKVTDRQLRNQMNDITYQVRKLGENYNQIVARYNAQAKMFQPDGRPYLNTEAVTRYMESLRNVTESLRDEVSVAIELVKRYNEEDPRNPNP